MNKFSVKKLLLTILCSVIVTTSLGSTYLFVINVPGWVQSELMGSLDGNSEVLKEIGSGFESQFKELDKNIAEEKAMYGEDYPSEELFIFRLMTVSRCYEVVRMYVLALVMGIIIGTIIYIVAIQNAKGIELIIELFMAFVAIIALILLANIGYEALLNHAINNYNPTEIEYQTEIYDLYNDNIFLPYLITIAVVYVGNMIYQKRQANKLNKELNKK